MTIQDLKDNRVAIINRMNLEVVPTRHKEFMSAMVDRMTDCLCYSNTPMELFEEVMERDETFSVSCPTWAQIQNRQEERRIESMGTYSRKFA